MSKSTAGFTAVELLITLFVAAAFVIAGYQLFNVIIQDGGETRAESRAGNVAYDYLRQYSDSATNPCSPEIAQDSTSIAVDGLSNVEVTVIISCPQIDAPSVSKVEAVVTYNDPQKTVRHATLVDKSKGAAPNPDIINGLAGWWKLNGNANASVGSANGSVSGAQVTSSHGIADAAYSFNGTNASITIPYSTSYRPTSQITVSVWAQPNTISTTARQKILSMTDTSSLSLMINGSTAEGACPVNTICFMVYIGSAYVAAQAARTNLTVGSWNHIVGTYDGSIVRLYVNGSSIATAAATGSIVHKTTPFCLGVEADPTVCSSADPYSGVIDDVRIYDRALLPLEILQLRNAGPR